ncbi:MAG: VOC family protein [Ginsengibacter sp.]
MTRAMNIPSNHQQVMPYLILNQAGKFHDFVETVFDSETFNLEKRDDNETIRHGEVRVGDSTIMFANSTPEWDAQPASLFIYVEDADATFQKALDHGAITVMALKDEEYGRTCGVKDPTGNIWWITSIK